MLPIVLYNGSDRWTVQQDIYDMVQPEPPAFFRVYQPHLRYYLIDEGRYIAEELGRRQTPLSGVFGIENAVGSREALQWAVDRVVGIIQNDPHKERTDAIITRWLKRHLQWLGAGINFEQLNSLVEDREMLAENLESWAKKERMKGRQEGRQVGRQEGEQLRAEQTTRNLIRLGVLTDEQIAEATGLALADVRVLRAKS